MRKKLILIIMISLSYFTVLSCAPLDEGLQGDSSNAQPQSSESALSAIGTPESVSGVLKHFNINAQQGVKRSSPPLLIGGDDSQQLTYSISPESEYVEIDENTGEVTVKSSADLQGIAVKSDVAPLEVTEYTISATGVGSYQGTLSTNKTIKVVLHEILDVRGTVSYADTAVNVGNTRNVSPVWEDNNTAQTLFYYLDTNEKGFYIDENTGEIFIDGTIANAGTYEIPIKVYGTEDYKSMIESSIQVVVAENVVKYIDGSMSYEAFELHYDSSRTMDVTWINVTDENQTVKYSIIPELPNGFQIDENTGRISADNPNTIIDTTQYTVTAEGYGFYTGKLEVPLDITVSLYPLTGSLSYDDYVVEYGSDDTVINPIWADVTSPKPQVVSYSISPALPNDISFNGETGQITVRATSNMLLATEYTIIATGIDGFTGIKNGNIVIEITPIQLTGTITYDDYVVAYGTANKVIKPTWTGVMSAISQMLSYSISPALPNDMFFDASTGEITVRATSDILDSTRYTITATGFDKFAGVKLGEVVLGINKLSLTGSISYENYSVDYGTTEKVISPTWSEVTSTITQTLSYSIAPSLPKDISFDNTTGDIRVQDTSQILAPTTYTITATGTGVFTGEKTGTILIEIKQRDISGSFSYATDTILIGSRDTLMPIWENAFLSQDSGLEYSVSPQLPEDIIFNATTGNIDVQKPMTPIKNTTYVITATGTGNYKGTRTANFILSIEHMTEIYAKFDTSIFDSTRSVRFDNNGVLYVAQNYHHRISRVNPDGSLTVVAGSVNGAGGYVDANGTNARFNGVSDMVFDKDNNMYIIDTNNNLIRKMSPNGDVSTFVSRGLHGPSALTIDNEGNLYVTESYGKEVSKVTPSGVISTLISSSVGFVNPYGITIDQDNNLYITDMGAHVVMKYSVSGSLTIIAGARGAAGNQDGMGTNARLNAPLNIMYADNGYLYFVELGNNIVRSMSPDGMVTTIAGSGIAGIEGGLGFSETKFYAPYGIDMDANGDLFISNYHKEAIHKIFMNK